MLVVDCSFRPPPLHSVKKCVFTLCLNVKKCSSPYFSRSRESLSIQQSVESFRERADSRAVGAADGGGSEHSSSESAEEAEVTEGSAYRRASESVQMSETHFRSFNLTTVVNVLKCLKGWKWLDASPAPARSPRGA